MKGKKERKIRRILLLVLFVWILAAVPAGAYNFFEGKQTHQAQPVTQNPKILLVGNSFTYFNNMPDMLKKICSANGINAKVTAVTQGGHCLYQYAYPSSGDHKAVALNRKLTELLTTQHWDYVVLQGRRYEPVAEWSKMQKAVQKLEPMIRKSGAQMVFFMTQAPREGHQDYKTYKKFFSDYESYQSKVAQKYYELGNQYQAPVAPVGIAYGRARKMMPDFSMYDEDRLHPNRKGSYLTACVLFSTMFGRSSEGTSYVPSGISKADARQIQALSADVTVRAAQRDPARGEFDAKEITLNKGQSRQLTCRISGGIQGSRVVSWESQNPKVAVVNSAGRVTAKQPGTAKITAYLSNGTSASCKVMVMKGSITLGAGEKYKLGYTGSYKWKSKNSRIAVVKNGTIEAKATGTTTITGSGSGGSTSIKVTVKKAPKSVKISVTNKNLSLGKSAKLDARIGSGTSQAGLKYKSSNPAVVSVDGTGTIHANSLGRAKITVSTYNGRRAVCNVRTYIKTQDIKFSNVSSGYKLKKGKSKTLKVEFAPANATFKTLDWKSSNKRVVSVSKNGVIRGLKKGSAVISATTTDGSKRTIKIKIQVVS